MVAGIMMRVLLVLACDAAQVVCAFVHGGFDLVVGHGGQGADGTAQGGEGFVHVAHGGGCGGFIFGEGVEEFLVGGNEGFVLVLQRADGGGEGFFGGGGASWEFGEAAAEGGVGAEQWVWCRCHGSVVWCGGAV